MTAPEGTKFTIRQRPDGTWTLVWFDNSTEVSFGPFNFLNQAVEAMRRIIKPTSYYYDAEGREID